VHAVEVMVTTVGAGQIRAPGDPLIIHLPLIIIIIIITALNRVNVTVNK
jgi:hypothetical protein